MPPDHRRKTQIVQMRNVRTFQRVLRSLQTPEAAAGRQHVLVCVASRGPPGGAHPHEHHEHRRRTSQVIHGPDCSRLHPVNIP